MPEIEDLVNYAILIAVAAAIILMITGRFLDLSVERQESVQTRATINLLQKIVTEGDFLMRDSGGNKMKLAVNMSEYPSKGIGECCDSVQYEYRFAISQESEKGIREDGTNKIFVKPIGGAVKTNFEDRRTHGAYQAGNFCYTGFEIGQSIGASVPVNVCEDGDVNKCEQGVAYLETTDSPLAQMSYWITQACNSRFDLSKRIPLADGDYEDGRDVKVDGDEICFKGVCKKFSCDLEVTDNAIDENLLGQKVRSFPAERCDFIRIVREGNSVTIYEGLPETEIVVPEGARDLPSNHDAWTETADKLAQFSTESGYKVSAEKIFGVEKDPRAVGENYVSLSSERSSGSIQDVGIKLEVKDVPEDVLEQYGPLDDCGGVKCVDMKSRGFDKINFKASVFSGREETGGRTKGFLTWKLYDSDGTCIEKDFQILGTGKEEVTDEWQDYTINLLEGQAAEDDYGKCRQPPFNFGGTDPFQDFDWKITKIEWSVCETIVPIPNSDKHTCSVSGEIKALFIDNFYFGVAEGQKISEEERAEAPDVTEEETVEEEAPQEEAPHEETEEEPREEETQEAPPAEGDYDLSLRDLEWVEDGENSYLRYLIFNGGTGDIDKDDIAVQITTRNQDGTTSRYIDLPLKDSDDNFLRSRKGEFGRVSDVALAVREGSVKFSLYADPKNVVRETDEANNFADIDVQVLQSTVTDCTQLSRAGSPSTKLDVIFIPQGYSTSDIGSFQSHVTFAKNSILSVEPFKSNANKFNFHYINTAGLNFFIGSGRFDIDYNRVKRYAGTCADGGNFIFPDQIIVLTKDRHSDFAQIESDVAVVTTRELNEFDESVVHEFGHSLGNLRDEFVTDTKYLTGQGASWVASGPNCDVAGCPKWCTGGVSPEYTEFLSTCEAAKTRQACDVIMGEEFRCEWIQEAERGGPRCVVNPNFGGTKQTQFWPFQDKDFGLSCQTGTGCYLGCGEFGGNFWRPSFDSVMNSFVEGNPADRLRFNKPSIDSINKVLEAYR